MQAIQWTWELIDDFFIVFAKWYYRKFDFLVSHLTQKTTSFEISQCGASQPSYSPSYMTETC